MTPVFVHQEPITDTKCRNPKNLQKLQCKKRKSNTHCKKYARARSRKSSYKQDHLIRWGATSYGRRITTSFLVSLMDHVGPLYKRKKRVRPNIIINFKRIKRWISSYLRAHSRISKNRHCPFDPTRWQKQ